jgi:hypothetical protein
MPGHTAIESTAIATGSDIAIADLASLNATSAAGGWTGLTTTGHACTAYAASVAATHGIASSPSSIGNTCRIGHDVLAHAASPASGPSTFRRDAFTIAAIPIAAISITAISIASISIAAISIATIPIAVISIGAIPIAAIPIAAIPIATISIAAIATTAKETAPRWLVPLFALSKAILS